LGAVVEVTEGKAEDAEDIDAVAEGAGAGKRIVTDLSSIVPARKSSSTRSSAFRFKSR
jgi:hypothetical protein